MWRALPWIALGVACLLVLLAPWLYPADSPSEVTPREKDLLKTQPRLGAELTRFAGWLQGKPETTSETETIHAARWSSAWAALLALAAWAFLAKRVSGWIAALLMVAVLAAHPVFRRSAGTLDPVFVAHGLLFVNMAFQVYTWPRFYHSGAGVLSHSVLLVVRIASGGLTWSLDAYAGMQSAVTTVWILALVLAGVAPKERSKGTVINAVINLVFIPLGSAVLALALGRDWSATALLPQSDFSSWGAWAAFWTDGLRATFFVPWWAVLPVLLWGWWRTIRRGARTSRLGQPPLSWVISLHVPFTVLATVVALPSAFGAWLPWCVFLVVFLVLDLMQGFGEGMMLRPPEGKAI